MRCTYFLATFACIAIVACGQKDGATKADVNQSNVANQQAIDSVNRKVESLTSESYCLIGPIKIEHHGADPKDKGLGVYHRVEYQASEFSFSFLEIGGHDLKTDLRLKNAEEKTPFKTKHSAYFKASKEYHFFYAQRVCAAYANKDLAEGESDKFKSKLEFVFYEPWVETLSFATAENKANYSTTSVWNCYSQCRISSSK